ncbi:DUF2790 domain-containing protein [Pseudomonas sp. Q12-87]
MVSVSEATSSGCGVVNARMAYLDSAGKSKVLDYLTVDQGCGQNN